MPMLRSAGADGTLIPRDPPLGVSRRRRGVEPGYDAAGSDLRIFQKKLMNMNDLAGKLERLDRNNTVAMDCTPKIMTSIGSRAPLATLAAVLTLCLTAPAPALAYIDPNAGGMLYQMLFPLLAAIVGGWTLLRNWVAAHWARLRSGKPLEDGKDSAR